MHRRKAGTRNTYPVTYAEASFISSHTYVVTDVAERHIMHTYTHSHGVAESNMYSYIHRHTPRKDAGIQAYLYSILACT